LILFIGGSSLDYFFANRFFTYNNHAATLGIPAPALGGPVPTFLIAGGIVPAVSFFASARSFINWRALSLTLFMILLISMFWEATLAVPYGWWGYQRN
jgi:hypothetical protein